MNTIFTAHRSLGLSDPKTYPDTHMGLPLRTVVSGTPGMAMGSFVCLGSWWLRLDETQWNRSGASYIQTTYLPQVARAADDLGSFAYRVGAHDQHSTAVSNMQRYVTWFNEWLAATGIAVECSLRYVEFDNTDIRQRWNTYRADALQGRDPAKTFIPACADLDTQRGFNIATLCDVWADKEQRTNNTARHLMLFVEPVDLNWENVNPSRYFIAQIIARFITNDFMDVGAVLKAREYANGWEVYKAIWAGTTHYCPFALDHFPISGSRYETVTDVMQTELRSKMPAPRPSTTLVAGMFVPFAAALAVSRMAPVSDSRDRTMHTFIQCIPDSNVRVQDYNELATLMLEKGTLEHPACRLDISDLQELDVAVDNDKGDFDYDDYED